MGKSFASGTGKTKSMAGVTSFAIGSHTNGSEGYDGRLDDVRIYNNELSAAEVLALYTSTTSPNNEEVLVANNTLAANENTTTVITSADLRTTDAEQSASDLTYTVTGLPEGGTILRDGTALGAFDTFTQADIDNDLVAYDHNGTSIADTFSFAVNDGRGTVTRDTFGIILPNDGTASSLAEFRALAALAEWLYGYVKPDRWQRAPGHGRCHTGHLLDEWSITLLIQIPLTESTFLRSGRNREHLTTLREPPSKSTPVMLAGFGRSPGPRQYRSLGHS